MKEVLQSIIKDQERMITEQIEKKYLSDNLGRKIGTAGAVVFPVSTEEVSNILKYAYENSIPVTPRGAGTNLVGSTVPHGNGIVLDLSKMNRILEIDTETFTATVEAGVVLEDFQTTVEQKGFFYPPDPGEKPRPALCHGHQTRLPPDQLEPQDCDHGLLSESLGHRRPERLLHRRHRLLHR